MKPRPFLSYLFFLSAVFFIFGCDKLNIPGLKKNQKTEEPEMINVKGTVIAKVNNRPVTLEELNREIDIFNASIDLRTDLSDADKKSLKIDTREKKINYLKEEMVRRMVFYQAALDRGLDRKEDMMSLIYRNKIAILASEMQNEIIKNLEVGSAEIEEVYKVIKDQLKEPEARRVREIVTRTEDEAKQVLVELYQQGTDFASLARSRSVSGSAKNSGDLGLIKKGQRGEKFLVFDEVAFSPSLRAGSLSHIFRGPEGYSIVKIEDIKEGKQSALSEVWDELKYKLLLRKQQDELDKVYSTLSDANKIKIEIQEGEIK